ncbi:hypothetical protein VNO78_24253 [Psophocarpus tetragonolobus]|uniref:CG-1 domain-containing protein n=1 Tax=Psophocarpus tetragonolobus TaxID=3891 RepID=A0AAN9XEP0_PSOTE
MFLLFPPPCGSLFLYDREIQPFFHKDGHNWLKERDGTIVSEANERLKVGNVEILNCYYACGEENPAFRRRSYIGCGSSEEYEHIVLVHYRQTRLLENQMDRKVDAIMSFTEAVDSAIRSSTLSYSGEYCVRSFSSKDCWYLNPLGCPPPALALVLMSVQVEEF